MVTPIYQQYVWFRWWWEDQIQPLVPLEMEVLAEVLLYFRKCSLSVEVLQQMEVVEETVVLIAVEAVEAVEDQ